MGYSLKDEGNTHFKAKNYKDAIRSYYKSILHIKGLVGPDDECFIYAGKEMRISKEQLESIRNLYNILYLNMAQCHLYLSNYKKAVENSNKALKLKESAKGFYRRGLGSLELKDSDSALSDFKRVKELDPDNVEVDSLIEKAMEVSKSMDKAMANALKGAFN